MKNYYEAMEQDAFDTLPVTFHIKDGLKDPEFLRFKKYYYKMEEELKDGSSKKPKKDNYYQSSVPPKNIWIIKPGELTNQGCGIEVAREFDEICEIIENSTNSTNKTCIV